MAIYGTASFLEQEQRREWSDTGGAVIIRTWEGPKSGLAAFVTGTLPAGYSRFTVDDDNDLVTIQAQYQSSSTDGVGTESPDGLVQRYWELDGNDVEKSLWEHPKVTAVTGLYSTTEIAEMRAYYDTLLDGTATTSWASSEVMAAMNRMARGVEAFSVSQYVLRKVEVVRPGTSLAASHSNVNRIFSYSALTSAEPTLADYDLVAAASLTALKWLKRTPDVRPTQNGLYEIVTEYWGADSIDTWIYETAV